MRRYYIEVLQTRRFRLQIDAPNEIEALALADTSPLPDKADSVSEQIVGVIEKKHPEPLAWPGGK